jgi:hypothetical protein
MSNDKNSRDVQYLTGPGDQAKVKFEVYGKEMLEKTARLGGNSGRVYLPPVWAGCLVKIIRVD